MDVSKINFNANKPSFGYKTSSDRKTIMTQSVSRLTKNLKYIVNKSQFKKG